MRSGNPYTISFGRIPRQYISRDIIIDDILENVNAKIIGGQAFKITGIRGTGKTVTLTAVEKELEGDKDWILVDLRPGGNITRELVSKLYFNVPMIKKFADANIDLSLFGVGINIRESRPEISPDAALEVILAEVKKRNKRVLIVIDEVRRTEELIDFIQEFQILVRKDLPVFLLVAGLYEDIESLENTDGLTFFLRAEKYDMTPLNVRVIREDYKKTLGIDGETAGVLADMTKGYAFAYQAFGKYMYDNGEKDISELVLAEVDEALSGKVYDKIWSELKEKDRWYLRYIVERETMSSAELLEITKTKHNEWSGPRKRLIEKGVIDGSERGKITLRLPRFKEYMDNH